MKRPIFQFFEQGYVQKQRTEKEMLYKKKVNYAKIIFTTIGDKKCGTLQSD